MPSGCAHLPNTCSHLPPSQCFSTFSDHDFYSIDPEVDAGQLRKVSSYQHPDHREEVGSRKVRAMRAEIQFWCFAWRAHKWIPSLPAVSQSPHGGPALSGDDMGGTRHNVALEKWNQKGRWRSGQGAIQSQCLAFLKSVHVTNQTGLIC